MAANLLQTINAQLLIMQREIAAMGAAEANAAAGVLQAINAQLSSMRREIDIMSAAEDGQLPRLRGLVAEEPDPARRRALLETALAYATAGRQRDIIEWCRLGGAVDVERARATAEAAGVAFEE